MSILELNRFVQAQEPVFESVCDELAAGAKTTHWMWFVFPQLASLGRSGTAKFFGIRDGAEAEAYRRHAVLGPRLERCARLVLGHRGRRTALQIFGATDALKLRSSMTLFERVAPGAPVFAEVLDHFCAGERDAVTLEFLDGRR
jgi:uncharacterized protein (DUF1810 family)